MKSTVGMAAMAVIFMGAGLAGCASSPWPRSRAQIETPATLCEDIKVQIYFDRDSALVTREGRSILASARNQARGCDVKAVTVLGLADALGAPGANLDLSRRRGLSVRKALIKAGFRAVALDVQAGGDAGATTAGGVAQPLRRRADITIDLATPLR